MKINKKTQLNALWVDAKKIKPDKDQPRKTFDEKHIEGLAKSIETEGLINLVEVDKNYKILTGECRYRAMTEKLGWDKVPVNLSAREYTSYERLRHQLAENLHQSGANKDNHMNPMDTAHAVANLYKLKTGESYNPCEPGSRGRNEKGFFLPIGMEEIAEELAIHRRTVWELLQLLSESQEMQEAIKEGTVPRTYVREAEHADDKYKDKIKDWILQKKFDNREDITKLARFTKIAPPDLVEREMNKQIDQQSKSANKILNAIVDFLSVLEGNPLSGINNAEKDIVKGQLKWVKQEVSNYIKSDQAEVGTVIN